MAGQEPTTRAVNGQTGPIESGNKELQRGGFGVFASHDGTTPNLMYNQYVSYTYLGDETVSAEPTEGYWSYSPRKYWPNDMTHVYMCAYAPYVDVPVSLPVGTTGIVGMSDNTSSEPFILYARETRPQDQVDLLWAYATPSAPGAVKMEMRHALARLQVSVTLNSTSTIDLTTTKVLLRRVTLSGYLATKGKLMLKTGGNVPHWTDQDKSATITLYTDHDRNNASSYGNLPEQLQYIDGLPYRWQPAGLQKGQKENVFCVGDYPVYVYLIPQDELLLTCTVSYYLMTADGVSVLHSKATDTDAIVFRPLNGNTTYDLNLNIKIDA